MELPKRYNAEESEKKWMEFWEKENIYRFDQESKAEIYSVDTPPNSIRKDAFRAFIFLLAAGFCRKVPQNAGKKHILSFWH